MGLLMGAAWLALPHLKNVRPLWAGLGLIGFLLAMAFAVRHPFGLALLAVIALLLGYLTVASRARRPR